MAKNPRILKQIETIESEIIAWANLLSDCKPDSTRLEVRIEAIENLIQVRKGLLRLLETPDPNKKKCHGHHAIDVDTNECVDCGVSWELLRIL